MKIEFKLNGQTATFEAGANDTLYGMLRALGISSADAKRRIAGCVRCIWTEKPCFPALFPRCAATGAIFGRWRAWAMRRKR